MVSGAISCLDVASHGSPPSRTGTKRYRPTGRPRCSVRASRLQSHCAAELGCLGGGSGKKRRSTTREIWATRRSLSKGFSQEIYVEVDGRSHHDGRTRQPVTRERMKLLPSRGGDDPPEVVAVLARLAPYRARPAEELPPDDHEGPASGQSTRWSSGRISGGRCCPTLEMMNLWRRMRRSTVSNARYTVSDGNPSLKERQFQGWRWMTISCADANGSRRADSGDVAARGRISLQSRRCHTVARPGSGALQGALPGMQQAGCP